MNITIKLTSTGYYHARGNGPCEFAQWPRNDWDFGGDPRLPKPEDFFPEASLNFRRDLLSKLEQTQENHWVTLP